MIEALGIATRRSTHRVRHALQLVIKGHGRALAGVAGTAFSGGVAEALFLVVLTRTAFAITGGDDVVEIMVGRSLSVERALLLAFVLVMLRLVLSGWAIWQSSRLSSNVVARVRHRLAGAFFDASWEVQQGQRAGSLQELLTGYSTQANVLMTALTNVVVSGANLVALTAIAIAVDPLGALVLVVALAVLGLLLRPLHAAVKRRAHDATSAGMDLATSVGDLADLGLELHVFHVQGAARDRVGELIERTHETQRWYLLTAGLTAPIYTGLAYLALLGALGAVALSDATSLTSLGAVMLVMLRSLAYGQGVQIGYTNLWATTPAIEEIQGRLEVFEGARPHEGTTRVNEVGQIAVSDLSFAYEPDHPVLRNVSFTIERREIVGIVGPSGGGKSTLVQLLLGLREPDEGSIRADGRDVSSFAKSEWARRVTFVPQASHLIAGTISENIRFMRDGVGRDDIERAARLAHLHDDITAFADGYERQVGEHGGHLSGGQQQRLCIARALVEHPDVMILDEPTSALDVRSEHLLRTTLFGLKEQMTVVIIAHRLSTLDICDRIMVIQGGELRGFDTPQNLEQSSGFYREALVLSGLR